MARHDEPPLRLRSGPQPMRSIAGRLVAMSEASVVMSSASTPQTSAARSTVHSAAASRNCSTPEACCAQNASSTAPCWWRSRASA